MCRSDDPRDQRLRSSALLNVGDVNILIDAGPDLRQQMLRAGVRRLDAILLTHEHNDHVIGLDDVRPFNFSSGKAMALYAQPRVAGEVQKRFEYIFGEPIPGLPRIELRTLSKESPFHIEGVQILPIEVLHGRLPILGFRFGALAYLTDVKAIAEDELVKLAGVQKLVINALQHHPHPTHLNLEDALALIERIRPGHAWLTHISHHMGRTREVERGLPPHVSVGYDGLTIHLDTP